MKKLLSLLILIMSTLFIIYSCSHTDGINKLKLNNDEGEGRTRGVVTTTQENLSWQDITTKTQEIYGGGNNNQHIIVEIDFSKIHKVKMAKNDPYWFKYLRSFWEDNGKFIPHKNSITTSPTHTSYDSCWDPLGETEAWWNYGRKLRFNASNSQVTRNGNSYSTYYWSGPFYDHRDCVYQTYKNSTRVYKKFLAHNYMSFIPETKNKNWYPNESGLGPNYHPKNQNAVTFRFKWWLNKKVVLANASSNINEAYYWRTVRAGQVTPEGWAIVPERPDMKRWIFVKPKSDTRKVRFAKCWPTSVGCYNDSPTHNGDVLISSPQLWGAEENLTLKLVNEGGALGEDFFVLFNMADRIKAADFAAEGFYSLSKNSSGKWIYEKINQQEAWNQIKVNRSLTINGSANDFANAMQKGKMMANEMGLLKSVHYYMPQPCSFSEYNSKAKNTEMRNALTFIYNKARSTNTIVNIQSHSWSGFVVATQCKGNCQKINHISYAPGTLRFKTLKEAYQKYNGTGVLVYGGNDVISFQAHGWSYKTLSVKPSKFPAVKVPTGHGLQHIIPSGNWLNYWK